MYPPLAAQAICDDNSHAMRSVFVVTALALASGVPAGAEAQQSYYAPRAEAQIQRLAASWASRGFVRTGDLRVGVLGERERDSLALELESGLQYVLLGICDEDCGDIDLHLFAPAGKEIAFEGKTSSRAVLWMTPLSAGAHRLEVVMLRCGTPPCYYAVQLLRGPPAPNQPR